MPPAQPSYHDERRRLQRVSSNGAATFRYTVHALDEMRKDRIDRTDVELVLRRGVVARVEPHPRDGERWNVRGRDTDGRELEIVIVLLGEEITIKIVTAWAR